MWYYQITTNKEAIQVNWNIPGTTLTARREDAANIESVFQAMFLAGGLTLSQVANISGLEPYAIQNWVKRGFLAPPVGKRYNMEQVCRILNINMLRGLLPLEQICSLMSYINGDLADESDDLVDDTLLYFMFVHLASKVGDMGGREHWGQALESVTSVYQEPVPGAREKLEKVLKIMLTAWVGCQLKAEAERMLGELNS